MTKKNIIIVISIIFILSLIVLVKVSGHWGEVMKNVYDEASRKGKKHGFDVGYSVAAKLVASEEGYTDKYSSEFEIVLQKDYEKVYQENLKTAFHVSRFYTDWGKGRAEKHYREGYESGYASGYRDGYSEEYNNAYYPGFFAGERAYKIENGKYLTEREREKENEVEDYKKEYQDAYEKGYKEGYAEAEEEAIRAEKDYERNKYNDVIIEEDNGACEDDDGGSIFGCF